MKKYKVTRLPTHSYEDVRADYYRISDGALSFYTYLNEVPFLSFAPNQWSRVEES